MKQSRVSGPILTIQMEQLGILCKQGGSVPDNIIVSLLCILHVVTDKICLECSSVTSDSVTLHIDSWGFTSQSFKSFMPPDHFQLGPT